MLHSNHLMILTVSVESEDEWGGPHAVYLNDALVGYRPYDGCLRSQVEQEVQEALADMLREKLGYAKKLDDDQEPDGMVEDGFGGVWARCKSDCTLAVVRPGKVQCSCQEGDEHA